MADQICPKCGGHFGSDADSCPACGAVRVPESGALQLKIHPPAFIIDGPDATTGDLRIAVSSPGGKSETRLTPAGQMSVLVEGAEAGRKSQPWAEHTLCTRLREQGLEVSVEIGSDDRGEDALFRIRDKTYVVQIVTTPGEGSVANFWRDASLSSASRQVELQQGVEWLRDCIEAKAEMIPPDQRPSTILAVDARHAGPLAQEFVAELYTSRFGDPSYEYGFASVWIVGPIPKYCVRLGGGVP